MEPWEEYSDSATATIEPPKPWEEFAESKPPWEEFAEAAPNEQALRRAKLEAEMVQARAEGERNEAILTGVERAEYVTEKLASFKNPFKLAEHAIETTASAVAGEPVQLAVRPSEMGPAFEIPQVPQQEGTTKQVAAGVLNTAIDFVNFFGTQEGVATLGVGFLPKVLQKAVLGAFAAEMGTHAPQQILQANEAAAKGDIQEAVKLATAGAGGAVLASVMARHATGKPAVVVNAALSNAPLTAKAAADAGVKDIYPDAPEKVVIEPDPLVSKEPPITEAPPPTSEAPSSGEPKAITESRIDPLTTPGPMAETTTQVVGVQAKADAAQGLGITPSPMSAAMVRPLAEPSFWKKWFTAAGNLPEPVHKAWLESRGEIAAEGKQVEYAVRDLYSVLQKEHGISSLDKLKNGMQDVPIAKVQLMDEALKGSPGAMRQLSPEVQAAVTKMRDHVDKLSGILTQRGLIDGDLAVKVGQNLGTYLTRSYRIFDDPKWVENIPPQVRADFETLLEQDILNRLPGLTPAQSLDMAKTQAREMLQDWSESGVIKEFQRGKLGRKDLTQFMRREALAPEIRAVLGEYKDPVLNYARSVTKIARFIGDQEFLNEVKNRGMGTLLFEKGNSKPGFEAELAAEESSVMSPLNGLRTSPAIKEAFEKWQRSKPSDNLFARTYFAFNALSKGSKTIGSLLTQSRNLFGQPFFNLMSGHWNFAEYGKSMKALAADIGITDEVKWRDYYTNLRRLNLVDESAPAGELRDVLRDAGLKDQDFAGFSGEGWGRAIRKVAIEGPIKAYRISDEAGKIVGFENEKVFQKRLNPTATPEQIETLAAERIRNTYPTYSMVPEAVRQFRKQPLFGPFVSFAYEAIRTSYHAVRYAAQDAKADPVVGAARIGGIITAISSGAILGALGRYLFGITTEEMDDVRRFLPPWAKNAQLIPTGKGEDGTISYINWSYQNPYSYLIDPFVAALADDASFNDKFVNVAAEFIRPFSNEQMLGAAVMDVKRNQTQLGREIYNPQDPDDEKIRKITGRLFEAIEPGTLTRWGKRILPAIMDKQPDFGRKLDPKIEIAAELTGIRAEKFDFGQGFQFKARRFRQDEQNAEYIFSSTIQRTGSVPDNEVVEAYRQSEQQRFQLWSDLYKDAQAAMRHNIPRNQIANDLQDAGLSVIDRAALLKGVYTPKQITEQTLERAKKAKRTLPIGDIKPIQKEMNKKPLSPEPVS